VILLTVALQIYLLTYLHLQVAAESEAVASNGSVFDVVHEFKRLHSTTWKLMSMELRDTARLNVDLVGYTFHFLLRTAV